MKKKYYGILLAAVIAAGTIGVTAQAASGKDLTQKIKVKVIDEAGNKVRVKQGNVTFDKAGT